MSFQMGLVAEKGIVPGQRADAGIRLTKRDLRALTWIGEMYVVRVDTVRKLLGRMSGHRVGREPAQEGLIAERNVRRIVKRWKDVGLAEQEKILYDDPAWLWLTDEGLRRLGMPYREVVPRLDTLGHTHLVNELRIKLEDKHGQQLRWTGERELRRRVNQLDPGKRRLQHVPDGEAMLGEDVFGIEMELTQKSYRRLRSIVERLSRQYDQILYVVSLDAEPAVKRVIAKFPPDTQEKFQIERVEEALGDVIS